MKGRERDVLSIRCAVAGDMEMLMMRWRTMHRAAAAKVSVACMYFLCIRSPVIVHRHTHGSFHSAKEDKKTCVPPMRFRAHLLHERLPSGQHPAGQSKCAVYVQ